MSSCITPLIYYGVLWVVANTATRPPLSLPSKVEVRRANGQKAQTDGRAEAGESTKDERDQEIEEGREADDFPASSVIG